MKQDLEKEEDKYPSQQHDHLSFSNFVLLTLGFKNRIRRYLEALYERGAKAEEKVDNMRESLTNRHIGMGKGFDKPPSRAPNLTTIMSTESPSNDVSRLQEDIDGGSIDDGSADRLSERSTFDVYTTGDKKLQSMDDVASSSSDSYSNSDHALSAVESSSDVVPYNFGEEVAGDEGSKSSYINNGNSKNFLEGRNSGDSTHSFGSTYRESLVETDEIFDFRDVQEEDLTLWELVVVTLRNAGLWLKDILWEQQVDERVEFTEHMPYIFRKVRLSSDFDDTFYRDLFSTTAKQRLNQGGKSGALFFIARKNTVSRKASQKKRKRPY